MRGFRSAVVVSDVRVSFRQVSDVMLKIGVVMLGLILL